MTALSGDDEEYVSFERVIEDEILLCEKKLRENYGKFSREDIAAREGFINGLRHARSIWEGCEGD